MLIFDIKPHKVDIKQDNNSAQTNYYDTLLITNYGYTDPDLVVLFDTGANIPVWVKGEVAFKYTFQNSIKDDTQAILSGFGHGYEVAPVYTIPEYIVKDKNGNSFILKNLPVAIQRKRDFSFHMILSFAALQRTTYCYKPASISKSGKRIQPKFIIKNNKQVYGMGKRFINVTDEALKIFEQRYSGISEQINCSKIINNVYTFATK